MTKLAKLAKSTLSLSSLPSLPCKFFFVPCVRIISGHPKSLVILYIFLIYSLIINDTTMAHCTISNGIETITGALKKTTEQGVNHITVTKKKRFRDPLTGEVVATGPNEIFLQNKRDYGEHPLTEGETKQRGIWQEACREAQLIYRDKSHPRFMEIYHRWRAQLSDPDPYKQFLPFIRTVLASEKSPN